MLGILYDVFYCYHLLVHIFNGVLDILIKLDNDIRLNVFIGVTGLMVAIIVFIAELVSNKKYELEKKLILDRTKIIENIGFCIIIFVMMILFPLVCSHNCLSSNTDRSIIQRDFLYYLLQLILDISIFVFMYNTFYIFYVAVKLNSDSKYYDNNLKNFVYKKVYDIDKKAIQKSFCEREKYEQEFFEFVKKYDELSNDEFLVGFCDELYVPIFSNGNGLIKTYNYSSIDSIIDNIKNDSVEETKNYISSDTPLFVFSKNIGDKVIKNDIIGYCLKEYKNHFHSFSNCIIYNRYDSYIDDELNVIHDYYFDNASKFSDPIVFDESNSLLNYFYYLYDNKLDGVRSIALSRLNEFSTYIRSDEYKLIQYSYFLDSVSLIAYHNDNYYEYKQINDFIFSIYYQLLKLEGVNQKKIAFNFSSHYFRYNYYMVKKNDDLKYYDCLLANLLGFVCELLKNQKHEEIDVVLNNMTLEHNLDLTEEFDEKKKLNLQFTIGVIVCLKVIFDENDIEPECKTVILRLIGYLDTFFINTHDAAQIILDFKSIYYNKSSIQTLYHYLDLNLFDHEYESSWSSFSVDEKLILRELLAITNIYYISQILIDKDKISKDDKFYYEKLRDTVTNVEKTKFEEILDIDFKSDMYNDLFKQIIDIAVDKENNYKKTAIIEEKKKKEFEQLIKNHLSEKGELEDYLKKQNKIEYSNIKLRKVCGTIELVPRELFFKGNNQYKFYVERYAGMFDIAKEKEFIKIIKGYRSNCNSSIEDVLNDIKNYDDYLIITSYRNYRNIKYYDTNRDKIIYNNYEIDLLKIPKLNEIILIKKKDLPTLQYCEYDNSFEVDNIEKDIYYELLDCSDDEVLRKEIIDSSDWLKEKGDIDAQNEYLKRFCRLRLFSSFRFVKVKNTKIYIFK